MNGRCVFLAWQLAAWSSWASIVNKIVSGLSEVDRGFMFCKYSFLGIRKLREEWSQQRAVSLELKLCVTPQYHFKKALCHQFLNRKQVFPSPCWNYRVSARSADKFRSLRCQTHTLLLLAAPPLKVQSVMSHAKMYAAGPTLDPWDTCIAKIIQYIYNIHIHDFLPTLAWI